MKVGDQQVPGCHLIEKSIDEAPIFCYETDFPNMSKSKTDVVEFNQKRPQLNPVAAEFRGKPFSGQQEMDINKSLELTGKNNFTAGNTETDKCVHATTPCSDAVKFIANIVKNDVSVNSAENKETSQILNVATSATPDGINRAAKDGVANASSSCCLMKDVMTMAEPKDIDLVSCCEKTHSSCVDLVTEASDDRSVSTIEQETKKMIDVQLSESKIQERNEIGNVDNFRSDSVEKVSDDVRAKSFTEKPGSDDNVIKYASDGGHVRVDGKDFVKTEISGSRVGTIKDAKTSSLEEINIEKVKRSLLDSSREKIIDAKSGRLNNASVKIPSKKTNNIAGGVSRYPTQGPDSEINKAVVSNETSSISKSRRILTASRGCLKLKKSCRSIKKKLNLAKVFKRDSTIHETIIEDFDLCDYVGQIRSDSEESDDEIADHGDMKLPNSTCENELQNSVGDLTCLDPNLDRDNASNTCEKLDADLEIEKSVVSRENDEKVGDFIESYDTVKQMEDTNAVRMKVFGDCVRDGMGDCVEDSVVDCVGDGVRDLIGVGDSLGDNVGDCGEDCGRDNVEDCMKDSVGDCVRDSVGDCVGDSVGDCVRDSNCSSLEYQLKDGSGSEQTSAMFTLDDADTRVKDSEPEDSATFPSGDADMRVKDSEPEDSATFPSGDADMRVKDSAPEDSAMFPSGDADMRVKDFEQEDSEFSRQCSVNQKKTGI